MATKGKSWCPLRTDHRWWIIYLFIITKDWFKGNNNKTWTVGRLFFFLWLRDACYCFLILVHSIFFFFFFFYTSFPFLFLLVIPVRRLFTWLGLLCPARYLGGSAAVRSSATAAAAAAAAIIRQASLTWHASPSVSSLSLCCCCYLEMRARRNERKSNRELSKGSLMDGSRRPLNSLRTLSSPVQSSPVSMSPRDETREMRFLALRRLDSISIQISVVSLFFFSYCFSFLH